MQTKLRKSIQVKFIPSLWKNSLEKYMKTYADIVNYSLKYTYNVYLQYDKISTEGECSECKKNTNLTHQHRKTTDQICIRCFRKSYSEYTLRKSLIPAIQSEFPDFSQNKTAYYTTLSHTFGTFKSWIKRHEQRQKDRDKIHAELTDAILTGDADFSVSKNLSIDWDKRKYKEFKRLEKDIEFPVFSGTTVRLWKDFAGASFDGTDLIAMIRDPGGQKKILKEYLTKVGDYQIKHILENMDELEDKYMSIHNKDGEFFLDVPYTKTVDLMTEGELIEHAKKPDTIICCVVFGIKEPLNVFVFKNNKLIQSESFGDETLCNKKGRFKEIDTNVMKKISSRKDRGKKKIKKQKKKWWKKTKGRRRNFIRDYDNRITFNAVKFIAGFDSPVVIMRDNSGIKNINYMGELKKRIMSWSVAQEQKMMEHKLNFKGIPVHWVPYKGINELICPGCGKSLGKVLTMKLRFQGGIECECGFGGGIYRMDANNILAGFRWRGKLGG